MVIKEKRMKNKLSKALLRYRKSIIYVAAIFIAFVSLFVYYDRSYVRPRSLQHNIATAISAFPLPPDLVPIDEIIKDTHIVQTFTGQFVIDGFSVRFATWARYNDGSMMVQMFIDNRLVYESKVDYIDVIDNAFHPFTLNMPVAMKYGEIGEIHITSLSGYVGSSITAWVSASDFYSDGSLYINGTLRDGDLMFQIYSISYHFTFIRNVYWVFAILLLLLIIGVYFLMSRVNIPIEKAFVLIACVIGTVYIFLIPPTATPDEPIHINSSYVLSNRILFLPRDTIRVVDATDTYYGFSVSWTNINDYKLIYNGFLRRAATTEIIEQPINIFSEYFHLYMFSALGIAVARIFQFNTVTMLIFGSIFNLVVYIVLTYFAIKLMPFGKIVLFSILLFPMSMQQAASFSPDSVANGLSFFVIAYLLHLIFQKDTVNMKDIALLSITTSFLSLARGGILFPLAFLCLMIPKHKFATLKMAWAYPYTLLILPIISFLYVFINRAIISTAAMPLDYRGGAYTYSLSYIFENPISFLGIVYNTLVVHGDFWLFSAVGHSMAWLNISVRHTSIIMAFIFITLIVGFTNGVNRLDLKQRVTIFLICAASFGMILLALFLGWTIVGDRSIQGVQGRYFLPFLPLLPLLLQNSVIVLKRNIDKEIIIALCSLQTLAIINYFISISTRG